tara:strand:+ start:295 stop:444 length:150 start_codon:yes stop_codon:yes gene_type:complete
MATGVTKKTEQIVDYRSYVRYRQKFLRKEQDKIKLKETIRNIIKTQHIK